MSKNSGGVSQKEKAYLCASYEAPTHPLQLAIQTHRAPVFVIHL